MTTKNSDNANISFLKNIFYRNKKVRFMFAEYLNRCPSLINKSMIKDITDSTFVDENTAYCSLLCAALGLNTDTNADDRKLAVGYVFPAVRKLDASVYRRDPYYRKIVLENIKCGNFELKYQKYMPYEAFVWRDRVVLDDYTEIPQIGYFTESFTYPTLTENGREWMTVTPNEIETMRSPVYEASGKVVVFGLGLGYYAYLISLKADIKEITIIEKDPSVISLFREYILPQFENRNKIKILNEDAFEYASKINTEDFDYAFTDIWHDESDGLEAYIKMKGIEKTCSNTKFSYWIEQTLLCSIREMMFESIEKSGSVSRSDMYNILSDDNLRTVASKMKKL